MQICIVCSDHPSFKRPCFVFQWRWAQGQKHTDFDLLALFTGSSSLEPLLEGLLSQIHIDLSWRGFGRNRTGDLQITQIYWVLRSSPLSSGDGYITADPSGPLNQYGAKKPGVGMKYTCVVRQRPIKFERIVAVLITNCVHTPDDCTRSPSRWCASNYPQVAWAASTPSHLLDPGSVPNLHHSPSTLFWWGRQLFMCLLFKSPEKYPWRYQT